MIGDYLRLENVNIVSAVTFPCTSIIVSPALYLPEIKNVESCNFALPGGEVIRI